MPSLLKWSVPLLALIAASALPASAQAPRPAMETWEYVILLEGSGGITGVQQLNNRGAAGWDLVTVSCGRGEECYYYMKRLRR